MGSDMSMAYNNWRPRPNKVNWITKDTIKVETDSMDGYRTIYEGKVTPEIRTLLSGLHIRLPEYVAPILHVDEKHRLRISGPDILGDARGDRQVEEHLAEWYDELQKDIKDCLEDAVVNLRHMYPELTITFD